jgi:hypothetical protein
MEINEIAKLIDLNKRKAGLEFKKAIGIKCDDELARVRKEAHVVANIAKTAGIEIIFPNQNRLEDLEKMLEGTSPEQKKEAISSKRGETFDLLSKRAEIAGANYENRYEVAKIAHIISKMDEIEKAKIKEAIVSGTVEEQLKIGSLDEKKRQKLARSLNRCGIKCTVAEAELVPTDPGESEISIKIENRKVWVNKDTMEHLENNLKRMEVVGSELQVKNAKRQILEFSEEEETKYSELQQEYLELLKKQDELLHDYHNEIKN